MARSRYNIFDNNVPHFMTTTVVNWLPLLNAPWVVDILFDSLRYLQNHGRVILYAYVIMENHLHLIASAGALSREMASFKSYTARCIIDTYRERGARDIMHQLQRHKRPYKSDRLHQFWQEGSHPQAMQTLEMMQQKKTYIHHNPVARGWIDNPVHWRYSSARNYAGMPSLLDVETNWL